MHYVHQHFAPCHHDVCIISYIYLLFQIRLLVFKQGDKGLKCAGDKLCPVYRYIPSLYNMQNVISKVRDN